MTFTAVVTAHAANPARILGNLLTQTRRPDEVLLYISDTPALALTSTEPIEALKVFIVPNLDDWGHEKRAMGLARAKGHFVGWFNHDDEYHPEYVERMLGTAEAHVADVVFCNWTNSGRDLGSVGDCEFLPGNSTSGNWIGRTSVVRAAGYRERHYSADASLIASVLELKPRVVKVDAVLYHHNP